MRGGGARAGAGATRLDRDDWLGAADAPGNFAELLWIPEALEIEQDDARVRVVVPVLEQIVAGDVGLVAYRNEAGDADAEPPGVVQDGQPEGATLGGHRHVADRRVDRRERRIQ